jgi:PAS domain S-box-containing protein
MRTLRDLPIKQKLIAITMVTVAASLLLAGIGIVMSDYVLFRSGMKSDIAALANIVGNNSTAALQFDVPQNAKFTLATLKARPHIVAACIYKEDGSMFAQYSRSGKSDECNSPPEIEDIQFAGGELIASQPIMLENRRVGRLVLHSDLGEAAARTRLDIEIVLVLLLASSLIALLLSSRLREIIATPIEHLSAAAASVTKTGDYGVRVKKYSRDELGVLVDSFNEMLERVESRDLEVENARNSLETTLTSIGDAVISTDIEGLIVFANPAARLLLRLPEQELAGRPIHSIFRIFNEITRETVENPLDSVLREETVSAPSDHTVLILADGTRVPIDHSAAPIRDIRGNLTGAVLVFRDTSSRRATEKLLESQASELRQQAILLKEADQRKDQFLAMLAHELRNPLAPIRNAVQVLKLIGSPNANHQWAGAVIERQTRHLARLVDDLLDVSRFTRGKLTLNHEPLELSTIITSAVEMSQPVIDDRKHQLKISLPDEPVRLQGDQTRLVQVVSNILNNAAKFTNSGGSIEVIGEHKGGEAIIRIIDNGIGLPPHLLPQVFDLFTQADRSLDRSQGGLGVGMTLVRNLVEMHGGRVEAKSEGSGRGSEFLVRLPALTAAPAATVTGSPNGGKHPPSYGRRILILEDHADAAEMLSVMLKLDGHDVKIVLDGSLALEAATSFQPEIILCDIGLPGMNGYQIALQLRARPEFKSTWLIALSGYGQEDDHIRSKEAGFNYHLTKPVDPDRLTALLHRLGPEGAVGIEFKSTK